MKIDKALSVEEVSATYVGRFARSIESGWLGKIIEITKETEKIDDNESLEWFQCKMQGVNELCQMVAGGTLEANLDTDDFQWFSLDDVNVLK